MTKHASQPVYTLTDAAIGNTTLINTTVKDSKIASSSIINTTITNSKFTSCKLFNCIVIDCQFSSCTFANCEIVNTEKPDVPVEKLVKDSLSTIVPGEAEPESKE
jgi:uncharacterized protein YjbI with pentapeptide repeats